ncbi:glutaminyl-tRNA synthase (glutamine-hydrolyzing) subunit B [Candidatus Kaiserbacteria bacterium RIFCSPHIGHO2_02_FULL_50_50]|uniref:Aspartyl/glutamyl-tRNA(Asn/Gln) amidotransferase subunit B n=1 Tax=Candidatus Kaiserbacteria bacterium RIFCSPHIGHO2_02_FULL_50_50 TaxID=1798492 RepID=A0A1F6DE10_9BACT|nr:MAG: glutaminyl-tRNA synthase (glutamine-hydrolyzing) subunit B [Candidatus Kaiserbacteria bacterium RIFCSPHIGHO2_02_FULL_50_50]OGG89197.1 MAG: glutaminyl-tRNA synthase (glutamine-hydrolyzing) subunit B [Candidatus Kaiserbacteria bacterium RIFCSPLOWO2_12_FULL_50_10]
MYKPTIGIEVHAELKTKTKMFCGCANEPHAGEPNANVCPVCMAEPGALPVVNRDAVEKVLMVGAALGADIATFTEFDRKHYFYPDLPKGYQISQYKYPLVSSGTLTGVSITRVHLEEDAARSQHEGHEGTLVDYNRAGVPLMELVTEPVIHDIATASNFVRELQLLLRTIGVSDANLEKGEMRLELNLSLSKDETFGTKVEVKNINSFRSFEAAAAYEIKRQSEALDRGERVIQETRGWDENRQKTFSQRTKEVAEQYRYMPDPDIPKFDLSKIPEFELSRIQAKLPEIPSKKRERYGNLGIPSNLANQIVADSGLSKYLDICLLEEGARAHAKTLANYIMTDVPPLSAEAGILPAAETAPAFVELITLIAEGTITSRVAKDLLKEVLYEHAVPKTLVAQRGLAQTNDTEALAAVIAEVIAENPTVADEYRAGKEAVLQFLVGQGMKKTRGSANPGVLAQALKDALT